MADNVTVPTTGTGDATPKIATDQIPGTLEHVQLVKIYDATADSTNRWIVDANGAARTKDQKAATSAQTSVAGSASDGTILASNANRLGATIFNDQSAGGATLYLLLASGTSSVTNYSVQLGPGGFYEIPFGYTGVLKGLWSSAAGNARVTEFTA